MIETIEHDEETPPKQEGVERIRFCQNGETIFNDENGNLKLVIKSSGNVGYDSVMEEELHIIQKEEDEKDTQ